MWSVRAKQRKGFQGFNRGGRFFSSSEAILLTDEQMTDAIRDEPRLIVEEIPDGDTGASSNGNGSNTEPELCAGKTKAGDPCKSRPQTDSRYCRAHQDQEQE